MWLLIIHIFINILGLIFLIAGSLQILVGSSPNTSKLTSKEDKNFPPENVSEQLENVSVSKNKLIDLGWYLYTFGVILGAFQAKQTVGYYWSWDLKEIFSLLSILGYFFYMMIEMKWNKRIKQILILFNLILAIITVIVPTIAFSYHNPFTIFS